MTPYVRIEDRFYPEAKGLRKHFDEQFANPLDVHENRFVWDFWNVPDQYCHLRTPAYHYFPEDQYETFHRYLVEWGRENLGCHDISPTWLSSYPEGSFQNVHVDEPHGPLAFVFSLTKSAKDFSGGETVISREKRVKGITRSKREVKTSPSKLFKRPIKVPAKFNRLVIFDPSFPHGVSETKGTKDPRKTRLVIHGWFVQPRPFWEGSLDVEEVQSEMDDLVSKISESKPLKTCSGYIGLRAHVSKSGEITEVDTLVSTLHTPSAVEIITEKVKEMRFAPQSEPSRLTIPLVFS